MAQPLGRLVNLQTRIGQVVEVLGRYQVWDLGAHKVIVDLPDGRSRAVRQVVNLLLDDASVLRLWVRPDAEMKKLAGHAVLVRGKLAEAGFATGLASAPAAAMSLLDIERIVPA